MTEDIQVFPKHAQRIGLCVSGQRTWMLEHGFEWRVWITQGLPASVLEATGDDFALRTVAQARAEAGNGQE